MPNADTVIHDMLAEGATHLTPRPNQITLLARNQRAVLMAEVPAPVRIDIVVETRPLFE